jgi:hypothetical protein
MSNASTLGIEWTAPQDGYSHARLGYSHARLGKLRLVVTRRHGEHGGSVYVWWVLRPPALNHLAKGRGLPTLEAARKAAERYVKDLVKAWPEAI